MLSLLMGPSFGGGPETSGNMFAVMSTEMSLSWSVGLSLFVSIDVEQKWDLLSIFATATN